MLCLMCSKSKCRTWTMGNQSFCENFGIHIQWLWLGTFKWKKGKLVNCVAGL